MAQGRKGKLNYRCPACFARDIDMDLFYDADKKEYYCLRCSYKGDEKDILDKYSQIRRKYKLREKRLNICGDTNVL